MKRKPLWVLASRCHQARLAGLSKRWVEEDRTCCSCCHHNCHQNRHHNWQYNRHLQCNHHCSCTRQILLLLNNCQFHNKHDHCSSCTLQPCTRSCSGCCHLKYLHRRQHCSSRNNGHYCSSLSSLLWSFPSSRPFSEGVVRWKDVVAIIKVIAIIDMLVKFAVVLLTFILMASFRTNAQWNWPFSEGVVRGEAVVASKSSKQLSSSTW